MGRRERERPSEEEPSEQMSVKPGSNPAGRAHAKEGGANALGQQGDQWAGATSQEQRRGEKGTIWTPLAMAGLGLSRVRQDIITEWLWASE